MRKNLFAKIVMLFSALTLSGCFGKIEVSERAFAQIMSISKSENIYTAAVQIYQPDGENGDSLCISGSGKDISTALEKCTAKSGKNVFFGQLKAVIIGNGINSSSDELQYLIENDVPLSCPVFYNSEPEKIIENYTVSQITDIVKSDSGRIIHTNASDIIIAELHPSGARAIPDIECSLAAINNPKTSFTLDEDEIKGLAVMSDSLKNGRLLFTAKNGSSVFLTGAKCKLSTENNEGNLLVKADIKLNFEKNANAETVTDLKSQVRELCRSVYLKSAVKNGTDIFGIYTEIRHSCPKLLENNDFGELLKNSQIRIWIE